MKTLISDTCEVVFKRKSDGKLVITAEAQLASISQQIQEEKLKGGIGNKTIALLRSEKEITLKVKNALFDMDFLSMTQGVAVNSAGTATVFEREDNLKIADDAGSNKVTITGTPASGTSSVTVIHADGSTEEAMVSAKTVTVTQGSAGDLVSVIYPTTVTGNMIVLDAQKFSEQFSVEYHTIEYDPNTNLVVADLYIQFDSVLPSGAFELSFESGTAITPELDFTVLTPATATELGRIIEVNRAS